MLAWSSIKRCLVSVCPAQCWGSSREQRTARFESLPAAGVLWDSGREPCLCNRGSLARGRRLKGSLHQKFPPWKVATGKDGVGEAACALLGWRGAWKRWTGDSSNFCCPYNSFFWKP